MGGLCHDTTVFFLNASMCVFCICRVKQRELAQAKLALAHTEAEKDELEVQLCNLQRGH